MLPLTDILIAHIKALLGDFSLEPSENSTRILSELTLLTSSLNGCSSVFFCPIPTNHIILKVF